eukprot:g14579.t1
MYGQENSNYPVLETYSEGGILEVKTIASTNHWGHIEMFLCDAADLPDGPEDSIVNQSCFNKYPLDRAGDDEGNSPVDPANRGRFILDPVCRAGETDQEMLPGAFPGDVATARFQLPQGVTCERCVIQMVYYTGNSCKHQGYAEFNPESWPSTCAPTKDQWINEEVGFCGEGDNYPEEFWNCADISITSDGGPGLAPTPAPESDDDAEPYLAPTPLTTSSGECLDPVREYNQCGGTDYTGPTCCVQGYQCQEMAECYSECRPSTASSTSSSSSASSECSEGWDQCGGVEWDGPTCCVGGATCEEHNESTFHQPPAFLPTTVPRRPVSRQRTRVLAAISVLLIVGSFSDGGRLEALNSVVLAAKLTKRRAGPSREPLCGVRSDQWQLVQVPLRGREGAERSPPVRGLVCCQRLRTAMSTTAAEGSNMYGQENSNYPVLETYSEGGILEVKTIASTNHWGHIEMFLCDAADLPDGPEDSIVTQSCFNKYPLDRAGDDEGNSPVDPANRGRFILDPVCRAGETDQEMLPGAFPGDVATARFQLPRGVTCERCVIQMVYYTGNSCKHQGYAEFNPESWPSTCAPTKDQWINEEVGFCGEGDNYPEEFWNCADISITSDGGPGLAPTPAPESDDDAEPYLAPTPLTTSSGECLDPVREYNQCGGTDYTGPTCCVQGYQCQEMAECYSECRPSTASSTSSSSSASSECSEGWDQCGGIEWDGPTCCVGGATCEEYNEWYHQCVPSRK